MTDVLTLTKVFGKYTLELENKEQHGPVISMKWSPVVVMGPSGIVTLPGGMVHVDRFKSNAPKGQPADILKIFVRSVRDAGALVQSLTTAGAGFMVGENDAPEQVEALRVWLLDAIAQGQEWLAAA